MPLKITGKELRDWDLESEKWFADHLGEIGDENFAVDGQEMVLEEAIDAASDTSSVIVRSGYVFDAVNNKDLSLVSMIRKWKKAKDSEQILAEVPKARAEELRALIKKNGGKIL